jgi:hypothetical protein
MESESQLSPAFNDLLEALVRHANATISKSGKLDPFGVVEANNKRTLVQAFQPLEQAKGFPANRLVRMVTDSIQARPNEPGTLAGIIYGAELAPVEGGERTLALIVWLEEVSGPAFQVVLNIEMEHGQVVLGGRQIILKRPIIFAKNEGGAPGLDVVGVRVGQMDIKPTTSLLLDQKPTLDEVVQVFVYGAVSPETKDEDWNAVAGLGIDQQLFLFERIALRSTAILLSLVYASADDRSAVEDGFWNGMDKVTTNLPQVVQEYLQAYRTSDSDSDKKRRKVYVEFSKRCSNGAEHDELIAFARRTFLLTLTVYREFLERHGWGEI